MPKKSYSEDENKRIIEDILRSKSRKILEITGKLRTIIKKNYNEFEEKGYPLWKGIGYTHPIQGYTCAIFPYEEKVRLLFEFGILLKDKFKKLKGSGSQTRHIEFTEVEEIDESEILYYIEGSIKLPPRKKDKLEMIGFLKKT